MLRAMTLLSVLTAATTAFADGDPTNVAWSDSEMTRPLSLPASKLVAYGDFDVLKYNLNLGAGITDNITGEFLHGGISYGLTNELTAGFDYAFDLHASSSATFMGVSRSTSDTMPDNGRGPLIPYATYRLAQGALSMAASGGFEINLAGDRSMDLMGNTTYKTTYALHAGALIKYDLSPSVSLFSGTPPAIAPGTNLSFATSPLGPGMVGNQLEIPLSKLNNQDQSTVLVVPVGVGLQPTPELFAFANTTLVAWALTNTQNGQNNPVFFGSDSHDMKGGLGIPFTAGAFFALTHALEIGGTLQFPDLRHAGDLYMFGFAARIYGK